MSHLHSGGVPPITSDVENLFRLSLDLICIAGADGYFKKVNPAFTAVLGYSEHEFLETPFIEFIHPDDRERTMKEVESQLQGSTTLHFENRYLHKNGSFVWLAWNAAATEDGLLYAVARDITNQKQMEEARSFEMRDLNEIIESNTDIFYRYNLDGKLTKWNQAMERLTGLTRQQLLAKTTLDCIYEEDRPLVSQKMREMFEQGSIMVEARFIGANGTPVPYLFNGYLLKDMDGTVTGFAGTGRDISDRLKAKVELMEQFNFIDQLINTIPNPVFYKDEQGRYIGCNKAFEQYIGKPREEIAGKSVYDISPKELADRYYAADKELFDNPGVQTYEAQVRSSVGDLKDVLFNKATFNKSDGSVGGLIGVITDMTEFRRTEAAHRESEERFRTLVETADDAILLMDMDFNRLYENEASWTSLGYTRNEWEKQGSYWERIHPDDITTIMESSVTLLSKGAVNTQYRVRHKNGQYITRYAKSKVVNTDGKPTAVIAILREITDIDQTQQTLRQSELLMTTAQRMAHIGGWEYNVAKQSMVWTDEVYRIHDLSSEDFPPGSTEHIARSIECYDPEDRPVIQAAFNKCADEGVPYDMEFPFTSAKGHRMYIRTAGYPVFGKGKKVGVTGVVGHIMDITQRKEAEVKLKAAKEEAEAATLLKDKFVSLVAHDLRSPLATITMMLNVTLSNIKAARYDESSAMIGKVNSMCETMMEMTVNLLDAAKLQSGDIQLTKRMCGIKKICDGVMGDLSQLAEKKGIALKNEVPDGVKLYVDKILFQRVVHNLVLNALKFSNKNDVITTFMPGGQENVLAVQDTGVGIHESILPNLFQYEIKTTTTGTSGERGTGFGLPMSTDIMKAHGGTIRATSQMGKGSTFYVETPNVKPAVLVVDDDEETISILRAYLEHMGAAVVTAKNGNDALVIVQSQKPALVITDLAMPGIDGLALLQNLKNSVNHSHIPVIIITGNRGIGIRQTAFECGADDFITKPLSEPDFIPRVGRFIAG